MKATIRAAMTMMISLTGKTQKLSEALVVIFPPVPAFYTRPASLEEMVEQSVGRMLDSLGINVETFPRWNGFEKGPPPRKELHGQTGEDPSQGEPLLSTQAG